MRRTLAAAAILSMLATAGAAHAEPNWNANVARAEAYAATRAGVESFVVRDESGRGHGRGVRRVVH